MVKGGTAIVTGASNGIGRAIALKLASEGFGIVASYYSDEEMANTLIQEVLKYDVPVYVIKADFNNLYDVINLADLAIAKFGRIDILVNNAGTYIENDFLSTQEADFDRTMNVILKSTFFLTQKIAQHMIDQSIKGRIINISSAGTVKPTGISIDYCVAKSGISMLTKSLAEILGKYEITINGILPGPIPTKLNKCQFDNPELKKMLKTSIKLHEFGDPSNIADAVAYFVSEGARWTTGALLNVDGGFTL